MDNHMIIDFNLLFEANEDGTYCPTTKVLTGRTTLRANNCLSPGDKIASHEIKELVNRQLDVTVHSNGTVKVHRIH